MTDPVVVEHKHVVLTERQAWMLDQVQQVGFDPGEWFRPIDVGGCDGSDHSNILRELCSKGLVERRPRCAHTRSYIYRLTPAGREWCD